MVVPTQFSFDKFRSINYPNQPVSHKAISFSIWALALVVAGYGGFYIVSKTRIAAIPYDLFVSLGLLVQVAFGIFLFVSMVDGNSRNLGLNIMMLIVLVAPLAISKLRDLAK